MRRIFESNRGPTDARWAEIKRGLGPTTVSRVANNHHHRHANEHTMCLDTAFIDICLSNPTAHKTSFWLAAQPPYSDPPDFSRGTTPPKGGNQSSSSKQNQRGQGTAFAYPNTTHRTRFERLLSSQTRRIEKGEPSSSPTDHPSRKLTND